jgi:hypothetical protein
MPLASGPERKRSGHHMPFAPLPAIATKRIKYGVPSRKTLLLLLSGRVLAD